MAQSVGGDPMAGERTDDPQKSTANRGQVPMANLTNEQAKAPSTIASGLPTGANSVHPDSGVNLRRATRGGTDPILSG